MDFFLGYRSTAARVKPNGLRGLTLFAVLIYAVFSTTFARAQSPQSYLEISAHGDHKITGLIVWKVADTFPAYEMARPFSFEWVVPPDGATDFMMFPLGTTDFRSTKWISLKSELSTKSGDSTATNIYISVRPEADKTPIIDSDYTQQVVEESIKARRDFARMPSGVTEGWCYIGNWDSGINSWKSVYWVRAADAALLGKRQKIEANPVTLVGTEIVADFPVRIRSEASATSPEIVIGQLVRPGCRVKVVEVRSDVDGHIHGVWAKVNIQK